MNTEKNDNAEKPVIEPGRFVTIVIDGNKYEVTRGRHLVSELKKLAKVPPKEILCIQKEDGEFVKLKDEDYVVIKGGEVFASQAPECGSS